MSALNARGAESAFRRGVAAFTQRDIAAALSEFDIAESLGYNPNDCGGYRWQCWMLLGEFPNAWRESQTIFLRGDPLALWDGRPFDGGRVVIRCLHGYGDAIQFLRYAAP